jgi:hypothetical protein
MEQIRVRPKGGSEDHYELNLGICNLLFQPPHHLITALTDAEQKQCTVNILLNLYTRIGRAKWNVVTSIFGLTVEFAVTKH